MEQAGDVGLIPWVPLTDFTDPPEATLRRCREVIEERASPGGKDLRRVVVKPNACRV
jgi:hypothetical protein